VNEALSRLWALAARQFPLGPHTLHGPDHWQRVERNGLEIARHSGADERVVRLFAVLHDSRRMNESYDPGHGRRAAEWARELLGQQFELPPPQFDTLCEAMIWHDKGRTSDDPTIGTCWDADRLDLPRVGIRPHVSYMSTAHAKQLVTARAG
jgi:uncharacterized protein